MAGVPARYCGSMNLRAAPESAPPMTIAVIPVPGLPMIRPGDDLPRLLGDAIDGARVGLKSGDVVAVCQKVVSKAEGAVVRLDDVVASPFAEHLASRTGGSLSRSVSSWGSSGPSTAPISNSIRLAISASFCPAGRS